MPVGEGIVRRDQAELVGIDDLDDLFADPELQEHLEDAACRSELLSALIDIRNAMSLSQKKVARAMGTTQSAVSELEGGATDPRISTVQRYARAVGATLHMGLIVPNGLNCQWTMPENRYVVSVNLSNTADPDEPPAELPTATDMLGMFGRYSLKDSIESLLSPHEHRVPR
jgi:transcriptional regulator with XRE-family HTH domain